MCTSSNTGIYRGNIIIVCAHNHVCVMYSMYCLLLFSILLCQNTSSTELRELAAGVITSQPDIYSSAVLGRPCQEYVAWILKDDSWGG